MARKTFLAPDGRPCNVEPWGASVAIDVETGKVRWETPILTSLGGPLAVNGVVFFGGTVFETKLRAYAADDGPSSGRRICRSRPTPFRPATSGRGGDMLWSAQAGTARWTGANSAERCSRSRLNSRAGSSLRRQMTKFSLALIPVWAVVSWSAAAHDGRAAGHRPVRNSLELGRRHRTAGPPRSPIRDGILASNGAMSATCGKFASASAGEVAPTSKCSTGSTPGRASRPRCPTSRIRWTTGGRANG